MKRNTFVTGQIWKSSNPSSKVSVKITDVDNRGRVHYEWVTYKNGSPSEGENAIMSQKQTLEFFNRLELRLDD